MRYRMRCDLLGRHWNTTQQSPSRPVRPDDAPALSALMLDAYRGTVDDGGEGPEEALSEIQKLLSGGYGPFDHHASNVAERDARLVSATLVTRYDGAPMIAFSLTAKDWQRRGLARAGLCLAMQRLQQAGESRVNLAVTAANTPALTLYQSLGFVRIQQ